jgi:AraC-like DNA-binding protein
LASIKLASSQAFERRQLASAVFAAADEGELDKAVRYIVENISGDIRMAEAAALAGMSETRFSRVFKRVSGRNFVDFVRKLRVAQACRLLRQTDMTVSTICFDVGFGNLSNFNRQFREEMGASPTEYRREVQHL